MAHGIPGEEIDQPQVPVMDLMRKVTPEAGPDAFGGNVGQAMSQVGSAVESKFQADSATWAGDQLAQARVKAVQTLDAMKQNLPPGDPGDFAGKFLGQLDKDNAPIFAASDSNPLAQHMVAKGLADLRATLQQHAVAFEAGQRVAYRADSFDNNLKAQLPIVEAHPEMWQQVRSTLHDQLVATGLPNEKLYPALRQMDAELSARAAVGLAKQDPDGTLKAIDDPTHPVFSTLSDEQRHEIRATAVDTIAKDYSNAVVDAYRAGGAAAGARALGAIDKVAEPDDVKKTIYAHIEQGIGQWHEEAQQTHAKDIISIEAKIASGQTSLGDIKSVYALNNAGALTPETTGSMIGRIQKNAMDAIPDDTFKKYVADAAARGQPLDPMDGDLKKGADAYFQDITKGLAPGSIPWINRGADLAARTGIVPKSLVGYARAQLVSGDDASAAAGAQAISRVIEAVHGLPYELKDDKESVAAAKSINDQIAAGTSAQTAVANARRNMSMSDAQKAVLDEQYRKQKLADGSLGALVSIFKDDEPYNASSLIPFRSTLPKIPPEMLGQFEQLRKDYYKLTNGEVQQANQLAQRDLKSVWGISEVNGDRQFMPYAPEAQNKGLTADIVKDAMRDFVATQAGVKPELVDRDKLYLTQTKDTATTNGQVWTISGLDQFGAKGPILDQNHNPVVFHLPTPTQALKSKATTEILERLDNERKLQAQDDEGNAWLHQGMLEQQLAENKLKRQNAVGEQQIQGRQQGAF